MAHEIQCQREDCPETVLVGDDDSVRCSACGEKHTAPWPGQSDDSAADAADTAIDVPAGATVRITIEIDPTPRDQ